MNKKLLRTAELLGFKLKASTPTKIGGRSEIAQPTWKASTTTMGSAGNSSEGATLAFRFNR